MKVLVAPTAFKGSLSAVEAARAMASGVSLAGARPVLLPISDGGDGLIESLLHAQRGHLLERRVRGPLGESRLAAFALIGGVAVIEMARASGLSLVPKGRLDPLGATSFGTGQLIRAALDRGAKEVWIGLGGSATNDGGAGMAQALGARLLDSRGKQLRPGAGALRGLARIDPGGLDPRAAKARFVIVSDVTNPLLGPKGSAKVYGPQKGASPAQVAILEKALSAWARALKRDLGADVARKPGAGAAGGLSSGLLAFLKARLVPGARFVLEQIGAEAKVRAADWVMTGEGSFDRQSLFGKAPAEIARLSRRLGRPAFLVCGRLEPGIERSFGRLGIAGALSLSEIEGQEASMLRAGPLLAEAASAAVLLRSRRPV